jgi:hypothetical protein
VKDRTVLRPAMTSFRSWLNSAPIPFSVISASPGLLASCDASYFDMAERKPPRSTYISSTPDGSPIVANAR